MFNFSKKKSKLERKSKNTHIIFGATLLLPRNYFNYLIINFMNFECFSIKIKLQKFSKFTNTFFKLKHFIAKSFLKLMDIHV